MSPKIRLLVTAGTALAANAATAQSLDQTREYAAEILADAQQRTSLLGAAAQPTSGSGLGITSPDGTASINLTGWSQTRYYITFRDDGDGGSGVDDFETGFFMPDTRLRANGSVVSPDTTFRIEFSFDAGGNVVLFDAFLAQDFGNGMSGAVGQWKAPATREFLQDANLTQKIGPSVTDSVFAAGRVQGVAASWTDEGNTWRFTAGFSDGAASANTPYNSGADGDWAFTARGDFAFDGTVDSHAVQIRQIGTGGEQTTILGGYFHAQQNANMPGVSQVTLIQGGIDFIYDSPDGWNFFGAGHVRMTDNDAFTDEFTDLGLVLQGGYFVNDQTEIFGAYDMVIPDSNREDVFGGTADPFNTVTVGVNHFPFPGSQAVKISAEVKVFIDSLSETGNLVNGNTNVGLLSPDPEGGQITAGGQAQVSF
ncbi:MAG TPA: hypothetical protein ENJ00_07895 [Phycisphaerales bacterium]|nr:hypothetical protein [Phycisphaerales bacterium]